MEEERKETLNLEEATETVEMQLVPEEPESVPVAEGQPEMPEAEQAEPVSPAEVQQEMPVSEQAEPVSPAEIQPEMPRQEVFRHDENSPFSPLYVPDRGQKKNNKITIGLVILLILCLVVGMIFAVSKLVEAAIGEASTSATAWQETFDNWKEEAEEFFAEEPEVDVEDDIYNFEYDDSYEFDEFDEFDNFDDFDEDREGYIPQPDDEYYVEVTDSIRDDLSYTVEKEIYTYFDDDTSVSVFVEYATVAGLPFDDKINEMLEEAAMYYAKQFGQEDATDVLIMVYSYITYMDEDILSVVIDESYTCDSDMQLDLYCLNFDLKTGSLLYNTDIIEPSEKLAEAFKDMSDYQNGYLDYLEEMSIEDMVDYMSDEDYLILFYTPVGLEVGFNHPYGWVTATLKDYEEYLSKL